MPIASNASPAAASQLADTVLRAVLAVTGMQVAYVTSVEGPTLRWAHVQGHLGDVTAGTSLPLDETFCGRLLAGAPASTADAELDPAYAATPLRASLGVRAYAGVPLRRGGTVVGTLGAMHCEPLALAPAQLQVLAALARTLEPDAAAVRLRRVPSGWEVEAGESIRQTEPELSVAMSLADLIAGDAAEPVPAQRPQRASEELTELERLRLQVVQLEHALSARVVIEQAIGVLAQRQALTPREAFDRMRTTARSRGQRVHDLAVEVVRSARDRATALPAELR